MMNSGDFRVLQPEGILSANVAKQLLQQFHTYCEIEGARLILIDL